MENLISLCFFDFNKFYELQMLLRGMCKVGMQQTLNVLNQWQN